MWHTLKCVGFDYYEAYRSAKNHLAICWIIRQRGSSRYVVFFCDGSKSGGGDRGSMVNARALASQLVGLE